MIGGLHRLVLFCKDPEASKAWYEKVGFKYMHGHDGMHWFAFGDAEIMLHPSRGETNSNETSAGPNRHRPAFHAATDDVDALFRHVQGQGLRPVHPDAPEERLNRPVTRPWGEREFELYDPDGHRWAFTEKTEAEE